MLPRRSLNAHTPLAQEGPVCRSDTVVRLPRMAGRRHVRANDVRTLAGRHSEAAVQVLLSPARDAHSRS
eukprot:1182646-Prorocentrum_minimum.AAC.3